jgi:hypothetical protein
MVLAVIPLLDLGRTHPRIHYGFTDTALNIASCYAIVRYAHFPRQLFMNRFGGSVAQSFPFHVVCSFASAVASWYIVELPMAGMRKRLRPLAAPSADRIQTAV